MGVDVRRGGKVAVSQPLLNVLEGNAVGQQQAGTAMPLPLIHICLSHDKQITVRYRFQSEFETYAEVLEQCRNM